MLAIYQNSAQMRDKWVQLSFLTVNAAASPLPQTALI